MKFKIINPEKVDTDCDLEVTLIPRGEDNLPTLRVKRPADSFWWDVLRITKEGTIKLACGLTTDSGLEVTEGTSTIEIDKGLF